MLSGTPLDLSPFAGWLSAIGSIYVLFVLAALGVAAWLPDRLWQKALAVAVTAAVLLGPVVIRNLEMREQQRVRQDLLDAGMAKFAKRCEHAGELIHRTVDNVEGVVWMKWRPTESNDSRQYQLDDPYGRDCGGDACILMLLRVTEGVHLNPWRAAAHRGVYRYVETTDPKDGQRLRYIAHVAKFWSDEQVERYRAREGKDPGAMAYEIKLRSEPIERFSARYGITWDDISTREDRDHWIAGGSLKVIDLQTQQIIAERVGYMMDPAQGSTAGFRSPWLFAQQNACPSFQPIGPFDSRRKRADEGRQFIQKTLKPFEGVRP